MIEINRSYEFKKEFCALLKIPNNQVDRRQEDLLAWLSNFFDFNFYNGKPKRIVIKEIYGEYQPMPRKVPSQEALTADKKERYTQFTIASLGTEFKPNSQRRIAREAIDAFGYNLYNHSSSRAVAERYIKEPFYKYGESNNLKTWVWYSTYEPLGQEILDNWRKILSEEHISTDEAANAFYRQEQGEDISKEKSYYKKAMTRFKQEYHDIPVLVESWKLKTKEE